jgi:hypothetical protein
VLIVVSAVGAFGFLAVIASAAWPLYVKPKLRRRYERNHHRSKEAAREQATRATK